MGPTESDTLWNYFRALNQNGLWHFLPQPDRRKTACDGHSPFSRRARRIRRARPRPLQQNTFPRRGARHRRHGPARPQVWPGGGHHRCHRRADLDGMPWVDVAGNVRAALFAGERFTAMTREVLALRRGVGGLSVAENFFTTGSGTEGCLRTRSGNSSARVRRLLCTSPAMTMPGMV